MRSETAPSFRAREPYKRPVAVGEAPLERNARWEPDHGAQAADTFYVASAHPAAGASQTRAHGFDISHRGGPPGFIHFSDDSTFIVPDFNGNNFYNTLGNLRLNDAAGLLFIDTTCPDLLAIEATVDVLSMPHPLPTSDATGRVLRFRVRQVRVFRNASPLRHIIRP